MFYVLWSSVRKPDVDPWEDSFLEHWDTAVKGSSALQASLMRKLYDEIAFAEGLSSLGAYFDLEKFYDSISIDGLIELAILAGYPLHILIFDIIFHLAPRVLKWNGWFSEPLIVGRGILAGTKSSNTFARIILYPIVSAECAESRFIHFV